MQNQKNIVEVSVTNPCQGISLLAASTASAASNSAEKRTTSKQNKYERNRITDEDNRVLVPFVVEFFGRIHPDAYKYIRDLSFSCLQGGKGQAGAGLRKMWFRSISCTLQRLHAISFKRNLSIARGEMKSSKLSSGDIEDALHINVGSRGYFRSA